MVKDPLGHKFGRWGVCPQSLIDPAVVKIFFDHFFDDGGEIQKIHYHIGFGTGADQLVAPYFYFKPIGVAMRLAAFAIMVLQHVAGFKVK